jgi:hypothetical protein
MPTETKDKSPFLYTDEEKKALKKATLAGGAGGAALGAKIGSFIPIPGVGTAAGATLGALFGGLAARKKAKSGFDDGAIDNNDVDYTSTASLSDLRNRMAILEAQQNSPIAMSGVIKPKKELSAITMSYAPMKMKAKEAERGALMMKISGASTMPEKY